MNNLSNFLATESSGFGAELGHKGGYIKFSNSGKQGGIKSFHISLEALAETLQNIRDHINKFEPLQTYKEKLWRDYGAKYFTNDVANATITVQTKPLFSTLSKLVKWANPDKYIDLSTDNQIVITEETLSKTLQDLSWVIDLYTPKSSSTPKEASLQVIYFGTPGSGKSHKVKEITGEDKEKDKRGVHRTTFHPDSDYASFVGCYKPTMVQQRRQVLTEEELKQKLQEYLEDGASYPVHRFAAAYPEIEKVQSSIRKEWLTSLGKTDSMDVEIIKGVACAKEMLKSINSSDISYSFTPQVFTEAYVDAWEKLNLDDVANSEIVYLVIEEINRGNCAQIFGDLFQLLDRDEEGYSDYRITADSDLREHLIKKLGEDHPGIANGKICLPPNLHILATMNTSDQSLFPMDSAFKRRWNWEYVPVDYSKTASDFIITLGGEKYRWLEFLKIANERIRKTTDSEDKQMGNFFIKASVSEAEFKSKVMFYLWNEVCRDEYGTQNNFFRSKQNDEEFEFSFNDLYQADGLDKLHGFMAYLGVKYTIEGEEPKVPE